MSATENLLLLGGAAVNGETQQQFLRLDQANRHGLIAGATGTGKTVTLQILAEGFSRAGVPVFVSDIKGDLSGISQKGKAHHKIDERVEKIGIENFELDDNPCIFWDLFGEKGHPVRATVSEMGPILLSHMLGLTEVQEGVLNIAFVVADELGLALLDLKDLHALLIYVGEHAKDLTLEYGNVSKQSVGAIQRKLLTLKQQGADEFFGETALKLDDMMRINRKGEGIINVLAADKLINSPKLYSTFLLWLLSELFEELPEIGDPEKPELIFFFDEAHLLFNDAPKALLEKIEQVVRLIRSKGVGIYFVTQTPSDIPDSVLAQLGNRIQHALRAFTARDRRAVKATADNFRDNPEFKTSDVITQLGIGEALVSMLDEDSRPGMVQNTLLCPPVSRIGPAGAAERDDVIADSPVAGVYDEVIDRESAYEILNEKAAKAKNAAEEVAAKAAKDKEDVAAAKAAKKLQKEKEKTEIRAKKAEDRAARSKGRGRQSYMESLTKSVLRSIGSKLGTQIVRGILGGIFKGR
jgi:DNA helicase HerA-like ATPase